MTNKSKLTFEEIKRIKDLTEFMCAEVEKRYCANLHRSIYSKSIEQEVNYLRWTLKRL